MQYALLIYADETLEATTPKEEQDAVMAEYYAYTQAITASGAYKGGEALHPTSAASTVRVRDGKTLTTHGPFAETKEQLGGFYLVECKNLDEAIEWAAKIPGARYGCVEVRPVVDFSQAQ